MPSTVTALRLEEILKRLTTDYPELRFVEGARFAWHPGKRHISYQRTTLDTQHAIFSLLHEVGHAILDHRHYVHDIELLQLEVAAWDKARELASQYMIKLDEDHIQDCLDTYRDWLHLRATCPSCHARSLQASPRYYRCHNCGTEWQVSRSRLCRPYRLKTT